MNNPSISESFISELPRDHSPIRESSMSGSLMCKLSVSKSSIGGQVISDSLRIKPFREPSMSGSLMSELSNNKSPNSEQLNSEPSLTKS